MYYLRPKSVFILYDHTVNNQLTTRLNVFQNFCLAAVKTHCFVVASGGGGGATGGKKEPKNIEWEKGGGEKSKNKTSLSSRTMLSAIETGISYMQRSVTGGRGRANRQVIGKQHVRFLGLHAFLVTFQKKPTRHLATIRELKKALASKSMRFACAQLAPVLDDSRNDVFDEIRF